MAAEIEAEKQLNNPPYYNGASYSGESSDYDDPNDAYYYPGKIKVYKHFQYIKSYCSDN